MNLANFSFHNAKYVKIAGSRFSKIGRIKNILLVPQKLAKFPHCNALKVYVELNFQAKITVIFRCSNNVWHHFLCQGLQQPQLYEVLEYHHRHLDLLELPDLKY